MKEVKIGETFEFTRISQTLKVRVMAVSENYVMARRPGCYPFVIHIKDFERDFDCKILTNKTT